MDEELYTIPRVIDLPEGMDYKFLKEQGIDYAQKLSGDVWTDYNAHDPGVTILEQLCYAITELSYKANLEITDILCAESENPLDYQDNAFFPAEEIFPSRPLTVLDYRRLLIDRLYPNVQNAWMVPLEKSSYGINMEGLYSVKLLRKENSELSPEELVSRTWDLLNAHRNLCEDIDEVKVLVPLKLSVKGKVELHPKAIGETVLAKILFELSTVITPHVKFDSLEELIEDQGMPPQDVFNGPSPVHGFVKIDDLRKSGLGTLRNLPSSARLASVIRRIKGVEEVKDLEVGITLEKSTPPEGYQIVKSYRKNQEVYSLLPDDEELRMGQLLPEENEKLPDGYFPLLEDYPIPDGYCPVLDADRILGENYLTFTVDDLPYEMDTDSTGKHLTMLRAKELQQYQGELRYDPPLPHSSVRADDIEYYYSIQNHFPQVYGIGPYGTQRKQGRERKVYAQQLKAYLFMMEQHLASHLSQITNFHRLFSLRKNLPKTYFHQVPTVPNQDWVLGSPVEQDQFAEKLEKLYQEFDPVDKRRNKALDHLMARFGEEFLSETYNALNRKAVSLANSRFAEQLLEAKRRFLLDYVDLSQNRGGGIDHSQKPYMAGDVPNGKENFTSLQKRIALFFNLKEYGHRNLADTLKKDEDVKLALGKNKVRGRGKHFTFSSKGKDILPEILLRGLDRDNFLIRKGEGKGKGKNYEVIFFYSERDGAEPEEWNVYTGKSEDECEMAILHLIQKLRNLNHHSEGFHIVEHVLLRPVGPEKFSFFLVSKGQVLLESYKPGPRDGEQAFLDGIIEFGKKAGNYDVIEDPENQATVSPAKGKKGQKSAPPRKKHILVLKNKDGEIIASKGGFLSKKSATKERKSITDFLKEASPEQLARQVKRDEEVPRGALLSDDFYSLTMSVVLPAWSARFRNDKIRALFEQVIKLNAPAHLAVKCLWVGMEKMADFERIFQQWMDEKAKEKPDYDRLDNLSYCLLVLLRYFENPADDLAQDELDGLKEEFDLAVEAVKG